MKPEEMDPRPNHRSPETGKGVDGGAWEGIRAGMAVLYDGGKKTHKWCE